MNIMGYDFIVNNNYAYTGIVYTNFLGMIYWNELSG